ncbi:MAG: epoxyalkane--coenzyme M transferase, partial [Burkholderiales bacterium]
MQRSTSRILTTHTGSLPRPKALVDLLLKEVAAPRSTGAELNAEIDRAVAEVVAQQMEYGIAIINDGEQGRTDYTVHVKDRLTGYDGPSAPPLGTGDAKEFPELAALLKPFISPFQHRPACTAALGWRDWGAAQVDIDRCKAATAKAGATEAFMTSPSPGQIARFLKNEYYPNDEAYMFALADVMKREYDAIVAAGLVLQVDCPDLALSRHTVFAHLSLPEFRKVIAKHVEALNHSLRDVPAERVRMHICWSS